tara:strand:+ start:7490 stop:7750 length:261 start_codon:yes stop_codon:yes gene_type:complete
MVYLVEILVRYQEEILNPEARAIQNTIGFLGYEDIENFNNGKYFSYITQAETEELARGEASKLCKELLANSVNERFDIISIRKKEE